MADLDAAIRATINDALAEALAPFTDAARSVGAPAAEKLVYTPAEAADVLSVSEKTVRRWVARGILPRIRGTRKVLVPRSGVVEFVQAACTAAPRN